MTETEACRVLLGPDYRPWQWERQLKPGSVGMVMFEQAKRDGFYACSEWDLYDMARSDVDDMKATLAAIVYTRNKQMQFAEAEIARLTMALADRT